MAIKVDRDSSATGGVFAREQLRNGRESDITEGSSEGSRQNLSETARPEQREGERLTMIYVVAYTLSPKRDATALIEALKSYGTWFHHMDEMWLIETQQSPQEIFDYISSKFKIVPSDRLLVIQANSPKQGWLPEDGWEWINNRNFQSPYS